MNYYIQGDAAKADQINAAFKKLGYDTSGHLFNANSVLYFTLDGEIRATTCNCTPAIIKTHPDYKELELPVEPKFKVGDWIARDSDSFTLSIKSVRDENYYFHQGGSLLIKDVDKYYHLWTIADAQDGDILHHSCTASNGTFIFKDVNESGEIFCYCDYDSEDYFCLGEYHHIPYSPESKFLHPATKEQRDLLFVKMREAGYQWDADKKELSKIIKPKFKVGDSLQTGSYFTKILSINIEEERYYCDNRIIPFENQDLWHLVPKLHYNISNFKPFDKVLVRDSCHEKWAASLFSNYDDKDSIPHHFMCIDSCYTQCIPFDGNEHLLGTTDPCDEMYINW